MKFKRHMELEYGLKQIDIAPLIDIIFQLLIFFMLTSSFIMQPGIKINLPRATTSEVINYENIEIIVSGENIIYLNGKIVNARELKAILLKTSKIKDSSVLIKADKSASLGRIVEVWDMCRDLGVAQINIATNQQ
ncbi:MAG: biopolymer transporter ExbD [Candidatus Omnitrophota bacterium]